MSEVPITGKRRSRFEDVEPQPDVKKPSLDVSAAAAKAAEISKALASQIASVSSLLGNAQALQQLKATEQRKPMFKALRLDAQGREIDEYGNLVKIDVSHLKTLQTNVAVAKAEKKKENPYLAHRSHPTPAPVSVPGSQSVLPGTMTSTVGLGLGANAEVAVAEAPVDDRIHVAKRDLRKSKGLHFIDAGTLVQEAEKQKLKEEKKIIAGYASGRKALQQVGDENGEGEGEEGEPRSIYGGGGLAAAPTAPSSSSIAKMQHTVPPFPDSVILHMEWWDEAFLPKDRRDARKVSKAIVEESEVATLQVTNSKTFKLVQHPVPVRPLGTLGVGAAANVVVPMYLTKQERKRIRRQTRQARELEKRDKMMMGLLPPPEPKFKLSNFMKIIGDQAVADPSLVEARVLQQMQQRVLNHEMRNQAAKLTPQEKKEKKAKKMMEDTTRNVHIAVFRVRDFSNLKYRFKVDVNAQQHYLTGVVLICPFEDGVGNNLVVAEGGPKGIRKFVRLMTERIKWTEPMTVRDYTAASLQYSAEGQVLAPGMTAADKDGSDNDSSDDDDDEGGENEAGGGEGEAGQDASWYEQNDNTAAITNAGARAGGRAEGVERVRNMDHNRCDLLWQGVLPKRCFTGFKFQETESMGAAKKMLKAKGVGHYWDMLEQADSSIASAELVTGFF